MSENTQLLTVAEASAYVRLSQLTLLRMRRDKRGPPFVKMGKRVFYKQSDLDDYINGNIVLSKGESNE